MEWRETSYTNCTQTLLPEIRATQSVLSDTEKDPIIAAPFLMAKSFSAITTVK
jgi:hypothetical protein